MKLINKVTTVVDQICRTAAACILLFICVSITGQVIVRKMGGTLIWVDELTRYAFIWLVLFGTVDLARKGNHISITSFLDLLPETVRMIFNMVIYLVVSVFSGIMTYAYFMAITNYKGVTFSVVKSISMSHYYITITILMGMITIASFLHIVDILTMFYKSVKGERT